MTNYLNPDFDFCPCEISIQGLAHLGDAVFELMVRTWLCTNGVSKAKNLHNKAVAFVSAKAQAAAAEKILSVLNDEETAVFKRGRNAHTGSVPKASTHEEYHTATGIESLFGYLYLCGEAERINELFELIIKQEN